MEREIKYRQPVWVQGKFHSWHYWGDVEGGFASPIAGNQKKDSQQYIGLKDSKRTVEYPYGQELYEGDKIKFSEEATISAGMDDWNTGTIKYHGERGYPAFDVEPVIDCDYNGLSYIMACCVVEVIGHEFD